MQNTTPNPPNVTREQAEATIAKLNSPEERAALLRRVTLRQCFFEGTPGYPGAGADKAMLQCEGKPEDEQAIIREAVKTFREAETKLQKGDQSAMIALADHFIPTMATDAAAYLALNPPKLPA